MVPAPKNSMTNNTENIGIPTSAIILGILNFSLVDGSTCFR